MKQQFKARSPAKLILSGEHSVLYGKPALAMAIDRYAESTIISSLSTAILFNCLNLRYAKSLTVHALKILQKRLKNKYFDFLEGRCGIRDVLKRPFELLQYTVMEVLETWDIPLSQGLEIRANSEIPIGCGMGSSAALVMSTLHALAHFLKIDIDPVRILSLGRDAENLQHGYSSGLDLQLAMSGGCLRFEEGRIAKRAIPILQMKMVQTGVPLATTGECVSRVTQKFKQSSIWDEFAAVTNQLDVALQKADQTEIEACIRENHRLLVDIGVVPTRVQEFVRRLEKEGAAAKICGAGSIAGENAGVVLIVSERDVSSIAEQFGYPMQQFQGDCYGTHLV